MSGVPYLKAPLEILIDIHQIHLFIIPVHEELSKFTEMKVTLEMNSVHSVSSSPIYPSVSSSRSGKIWNLAGDKLKTDDGSGKCGGEPLRTDQTDKDKAEEGAMCQGKAHSKEGWWSHGNRMGGAKTLQICWQAFL